MKWLLGLVAVLAAAFIALLLFLAREVPAAVVAIPADATTVLDDPRFAEPEGWSWRTLRTDGGSVRWGHTSPDAPRAVVLFLPGYSAPLEIYFETFSRLREAGYAVVGMDWPGQGGSSRGSEHPQKIHAASFDGHMAAAEAISRAMDRQFGELPRMLVGLSMGAQLGTRLLAGSGRFDAAALITPAYGLAGGRPTAAERVLLRTLTAVGFGDRYAPGSTDWVFDLNVHNGTDSACSHPNDRTRLWYAHMAADESLKVGGMTNAFALALVESGERAASRETLSDIAIPVWMPLAEDERFVDNAAARDACAVLADCESQLYAAARHCLFEEDDTFYRPFMADLVRFLDRHDAPAAP